MTTTLRKLRIPIALLVILMVIAAIGVGCKGPGRHAPWFTRLASTVVTPPLTGQVVPDGNTDFLFGGPLSHKVYVRDGAFDHLTAINSTVPGYWEIQSSASGGLCFKVNTLTHAVGVAPCVVGSSPELFTFITNEFGNLVIQNLATHLNLTATNPAGGPDFAGVIVASGPPSNFNQWGAGVLVQAPRR